MTRTRRPEVQAEVDVALTQSTAQWLSSAATLKTETLVFLSRILIQRGEDTAFGKLVLDHIHKRAAGIASRNCRGLSETDTQEVIEKVLYLITDELLSPASSSLHYLEISFGSFVKRKTLNFARDARRRSSRTDSLDDERQSLQPAGDSQQFEREKREFSARMEIKMALGKVLPRMKDEIRVAFEYWYFHDMPIETKKPGQLSIEKLVARDKRTVYSWLKKVFEAIEAELGRKP